MATDSSRARYESIISDYDISDNFRPEKAERYVVLLRGNEIVEDALISDPSLNVLLDKAASSVFDSDHPRWPSMAYDLDTGDAWEIETTAVAKLGKSVPPQFNTNQ